MARRWLEGDNWKWSTVAGGRFRFDNPKRNSKKMKTLWKPGGLTLAAVMLVIGSLFFTPLQIQAAAEASSPNTEAKGDDNKSEGDAKNAEDNASGDAKPDDKKEKEELNVYDYDSIEKQGADNPFFTTSNLWLLLAAGLVFLMHLGFATLESGLSRSKNTVNVLFKNVFIICIGVLCYALWGFNSMYPGNTYYATAEEVGEVKTASGKVKVYAKDDKSAPAGALKVGDNYLKPAGEDNWGGYFAAGSWFGNPESKPTEAKKWNQDNLSSDYGDYNWWTDFIFQAMFAATAATIVSGAVAERIKLSSFMIFTVLLVMIAYPISGSWKWGYGFLDYGGFYDFAGSSVVHSFGGFAALACAMLLGPRKGKYTDDGIKPIPGHSMPLATIGVFLLFLGWFGFNGGSVLNADPLLVGHVFVSTALAACAGGFAAIVASWVKFQKPDLSMALNGILAGLVGITAGADTVGMGSAVIIGLIAGVLVVFSIVFFDSIKIDDPVGAISVHGICGIWGTIAVGIFSFNADHSFATQLKGTLIISGWAFAFSLVVFGAIKAIMGVRVDEEEEVQGLDLSEHGQEAYPDFTVKSES